MILRCKGANEAWSWFLPWLAKEGSIRMGLLRELSL